jgi:hypothetical protein
MFRANLAIYRKVVNKQSVSLCVTGVQLECQIEVLRKMHDKTFKICK